MRNLCKELHHYFMPSSEVQILQLKSSTSPMSYERKSLNLIFGERESEDESFVKFSRSRSLDRDLQRYQSCHGQMLIEDFAQKAFLDKNAFGKVNDLRDSVDEFQPDSGERDSCFPPDDNVDRANEVEANSFHCGSSVWCPSEDHTLASKDSVDAVKTGLEEKGRGAYDAVASVCEEKNSESGSSDDNSSSLRSYRTSEDDDGSVASKILGRSFSNSLFQNTARGSSNESFYQKSLKIRGVELQNCTEELGSESSDVQEEGIRGESWIEKDSEENASVQDLTEKAGLADEASSGSGFFKSDGDTENEGFEETPWASVEPELIPDMSYTRKYTRKFPPPLSSITMTGSPDRPPNSCLVILRPYRKDGRFVLREVRIPSRDFLVASRKDGRLRLKLVSHSEVPEHNNEKSDVFGVDGFRDRISEEFPLQEEEELRDNDMEKRSVSSEEEDYSPNMELENNIFGGKTITRLGIANASQAAKEVEEQENDSETGEKVAEKDYSSRLEEFFSMRGAYPARSNFNHSEGSCFCQNKNLQVSFLTEELSCCRLRLDDVTWRLLLSQPLFSVDSSRRQESGCLNAIASDLGKLLDSFGVEAGDGKCFAAQLKDDFWGNSCKHIEDARSLPATVSHDNQTYGARVRAPISKFELVQNISCREGLDRAERKNCSTYWELHCVATSS